MEHTVTPSFNQHFAVLSGLVDGQAPHRWQSVLGVHADCSNRLIRIPTGMGETVGVLAAWSFNRVVLQRTKAAMRAADQRASRDATLADPAMQPDNPPHGLATEHPPLAGPARSRKLCLSWNNIPASVARSMAFEGEPVDQRVLEAAHARRPMPSPVAKAGSTR